MISLCRDTKANSRLEGNERQWSMEVQWHTNNPSTWDPGQENKLQKER